MENERCEGCYLLVKIQISRKAREKNRGGLKEVKEMCRREGIKEGTKE